MNVRCSSSSLGHAGCCVRGVQLPPTEVSHRQIAGCETSCRDRRFTLRMHSSASMSRHSSTLVRHPSGNSSIAVDWMSIPSMFTTLYKLHNGTAA